MSSVPSISATTETHVDKIKHLAKDPFAPSVTVHPTTSPRDTSRDVTLPDLPELFDPDFLNKLLPKIDTSISSPKAPESKKSAFMDALDKEENKQFTQNLAHGFKSTGSATVDAFNGLNPQTAHADYDRLLARSWSADPLATLKIIWNLRSIHEGKSEREGFYRAWGWLYRNHPRTAILNLSALTEPLIEKKLKKKANKEDGDDDDDLVLVGDEPKERVVRGMSHGYWKDPLNLLILAASGELNSCTQTFSSLHAPKTEKTMISQPQRAGRRVPYNGVRRSKSTNSAGGHRGHKVVNKNAPKPTTSGEERIAQALQRDAENSAKAKEERAKRDEKARKGIEELINTSQPFKALFVCVARMFADALERDVRILEQIADPATADDERINLSFQLSLAAKFAPSLGGTHDRKSNISSAIAALLGERNALHVQYAPPSPRHAIPVEQMHNLRMAYTRWVISPLRRFMQIPELYMSTNRWNQLPYQRVGSTCMQKNKKLFIKHDKARFSKYLRDVASGKRTISGATLLPHTLLMEALDASDDGSGNPEEMAVVEAQWKTLVEKLREAGTLEDCLAICDVSGSMGSLGSHRGWKGPIDPIYPAIALSLVLSQVSREPWKDRFITFSESPEIVKLNPADGFIESVRRMGSANWGMNTDFNAVFLKLILPLAISNKLPKDEMIKRLFVFSDMEFDESTTFVGDLKETWTTEHEKVAKAFAEAGYEVPEIVYWNLNGAEGSKPVQADWEGVVCLSGFSPNMLKTFMEDGGVEALQEEMEKMEVVEVEQADGETVITTKPEKQKMTPEIFLQKALGKPSYATLVVED
ncbi:Uncharacterized protein L728 [Serendipita indica DSM 11827]|uniref:DUF2828 domain-containing protein n=1 Tax=Serendipita indica (strain DSM 11827) TaxID=1109443 RepID=G4TKQ8_SERID|nr:Uncharacterized protein L728 [Serendipita indica DSM 11827]CCA71901.1 hypothetical protein PIIN_05836 [Serendipita indica DSM 11827]